MSPGRGRQWRRRCVVVAALMLLVAGCRGGGADKVATERLPPPFAYVAVGGGETLGAGADDPGTGSWPNVFYRTALARSARLVNVGQREATVRQALDRQLPLALAEEPRLVTVWLNVGDLVRQVPVEQYERDLGSLVRSLRRGGMADVLIATTPPVMDLPVVKACLPGGAGCRLPTRLPSAEVIAQRITAYDAAITRVAQAEGAVTVDLAAAVGGGTSGLVATDGFSPSTEGHRKVASAFAAALASLPSASELRPPPGGPLAQP